MRDDIKATPKMNLILVWADYGHPSVKKDEVFKEILEQADILKNITCDKMMATESQNTGLHPLSPPINF